LELVAIVHALKIWERYLMSKIFKLITNHNGLKYLFEQPNLKGKQAKWLKDFYEFDF
jgi:hypothetical protein